MAKVLERSDVLPRIGTSLHDIESQINIKTIITPITTTTTTTTQKKRKGPNVPPNASRLPKDRKQTLAAIDDFSSSNIGDLTVSGVNKNADESTVKVAEWTARNELDLYAILNPPEERNNDQVTEESIKLTIKPLGPQSNPEAISSSTPVISQLSTGEDLIEAELVEWDDFNNKERLDENMNSLFTCKKVILELQVAKLDYIPGIIALPIFHCMRCWDAWKKKVKMDEDCGEEANPVRGVPMALDENDANLLLTNQNNISYIKVRGRKPSYNTIDMSNQRRSTLAMAFSSNSSMSNPSTPGTGALRKYGGMNEGLSASLEEMNFEESENSAENAKSGDKAQASGQDQSGDAEEKSKNSSRNVDLGTYDGISGDERTRRSENAGIDGSTFDKNMSTNQKNNGIGNLIPAIGEEKGDILKQEANEKSKDTTASIKLGKSKSKTGRKKKNSLSGASHEKSLRTLNSIAEIDASSKTDETKNSENRESSKGINFGSNPGNDNFSASDREEKSNLRNLPGIHANSNALLAENTKNRTDGGGDTMQNLTVKNSMKGIGSNTQHKQLQEQQQQKQQQQLSGRSSSYQQKQAKQSGQRPQRRGSRDTRNNNSRGQQDLLSQSGTRGGGFDPSSSMTVNYNQMNLNYNENDPDALEMFPNGINEYPPGSRKSSKTNRLGSLRLTSGSDDSFRKHGELPPLDHTKLSSNNSVGSSEFGAIKIKGSGSDFSKQYSSHAMRRPSQLSSPKRRDSSAFKRNQNSFYKHTTTDKNKTDPIGALGFEGRRKSDAEFDGEQSVSPMREFYTPSPVIHMPVSYGELMCLNLMNFTSSFTFSFYELPEQYKSRNLGKGNSKTKSKKGKKKK